MANHSNLDPMIIEAIKLQQRKDAIDERLDVIKAVFRDIGPGTYEAPSYGSIKVGNPVERTFKGVELEIQQDKLDSDTKTKLVEAGVLKVVDVYSKPSAAKVSIILNDLRKRETVEVNVG